jgi:hypothetical protein
VLQSDSLSALKPLLPQQKLWQQSWNWGSSNALHHHQQQQQPSSQNSASTSTAAAAAADAPARPRRQQQQQQQSRLVRLVQGNSLKLQLKQDLQGLDLTADLAMNEMSVDGVTRYAVTPLRLALDVAPSRSSTKRLKPREGSSSSSSSGSAAASSGSSDAAVGSGSGSGSSWLQGVLFRVGVHGVVAPAEAASTAAVGSTGTARATGSGTTSNQQQQQQQREHGVCLHAQGALALTGSKTLWEAKDRPWEAAAAERRRHHKQQQRQKQAHLQQAELAIQPLQLPDSDTTTSSSSSSSGGLTKQQSPTPAPTPHDSSSSSSTAGGTSSTAGGMSSTAGGTSSTASKQQQKKASGSSGSRHSSSSSSRGGGGKPRVLSFQGQEFKLPLLNPGSVQESVQDASSSLERLRTDLRSWTARVEAGELQDIGKKEPAAGALTGQRLEDTLEDTLEV